MQQSEVIKVGNVYRMYSAGRARDFHLSIVVATSTDRINWDKYPNPVLIPSLSCESSPSPVSIQNINNIYYLYYLEGWYPFGTTKNGLAISSDGVNFIKEPQPIILPSFTWEMDGYINPVVFYEEGKLKCIT